MDREKVIKGLEGMIDYFFDIFRNDTDSYKCAKAQEYSDCAIDAIAMLKEQEDEKKRIMKVIWDTLHEGLSIDTVADQDWVYERIRHQIEDT